jgi:hypothetical protein
MRWTFTSFTKAPIRDGMSQRFECRWIILNNGPVFVSDLLQLINGKPMEIGVCGLIMATAVMLCDRATE